MLRQRIYIPRYHWEVVVYYDTRQRDAWQVLDEMDELGVDEKTFRLAAENLDSGLVDTGLTYSNMDAQKSIIVLSRASSKAEFANTWFHELIHCANHIAKSNGLDPMGEPIAYVGGELARSMQPIAARLMCPTCND